MTCMNAEPMNPHAEILWIAAAPRSPCHSARRGLAQNASA